jgi:hypothetical protein
MNDPFFNEKIFILGLCNNFEKGFFLFYQFEQIGITHGSAILFLSISQSKCCSGPQRTLGGSRVGPGVVANQAGRPAGVWRNGAIVPGKKARQGCT